jgi:hypothetical protein
MNLETVDTRAALIEGTKASTPLRQMAGWLDGTVESVTLDRRLELEAEARTCMYVSTVMLSFRWPTKWAISAHDRP